MRAAASIAFALCAIGCDAPSTNVVLANDYAPSSGYVVVAARWSTVAYSTPIEPGASSDPQPAIAASPNTAWALLAHGTPASLIVLQSIAGFEVHLNQTLRIAIDDATFAGNCAAGSTLAQSDADFITTRVFAADFTGARYDAATCTTSTP